MMLAKWQPDQMKFLSIIFLIFFILVIIETLAVKKVS